MAGSRAVLAAALLLACGDDLGPRVPAAIEVTPAAPQIAVGTTLQLEAAVVDAAGNRIDGDPVSFASSDPDTVTVDEHGLLTAGDARGRAVITAASGDLTAEVAVEVVFPASALVVRPSSLELDTDETAGLAVTVTDENGQPTEEPVVTFESSNPSVVLVVEDFDTPYLQAGRAGTATVTVTSGTLRTDVPVTVGQTPTRLAISPTSVVLVPGESRQLVAAILDKTGDEIVSTGETFAWSSSDPAVLTVDQFGVIKSVGPDGAAVVTATGGDFTSSIGVFVGTAPAGEILSRAAPHDWVYGVGVTPTGRYLVSASGELLGGTLPDFTVPLRIPFIGNPGGIAFNGSVSRAYVTGAIGGIGVIDLKTNAVIDVIPVRMGNGESVGISGDGSILIGGGSDGFEVVDVASKTSLGGAAVGAVSKVTRHPLKPLFYLTASYHAVYEVDGRSGEILRRFPWIAQSHVVTPDGTRLYAVGAGDSIGVWNLETGEQERTLTGSGGGDVDITPDGRFLYVIGRSQLYIVERTAGAVVRTVTLGGAAWKIAMSHDGIAVISNFDFNSGWVDFVR